MTGSQTEFTRATAIAFRGEYMVLRLTDGRELAVPLYWYPRLAKATPAQRANWEWISEGEAIHWPEIDEDLEVQGILEGRRSPEYYREQQQIGGWFNTNAAKIADKNKTSPKPYTGNNYKKLAGDPATLKQNPKSGKKK
jgi:hypothetical protein